MAENAIIREACKKMVVEIKIRFRRVGSVIK